MSLVEAVVLVANTNNGPNCCVIRLNIIFNGTYIPITSRVIEEGGWGGEEVWTNPSSRKAAMSSFT